MQNKRTKTRVQIFMILLFISVLTIFPYFLKDFVYLQDDLLFHKTRLESYYEAVKHLNFFPKVFSNMGNNYGYGADLFYPSIFLLPFAGLRWLGFNFIHAFFLYQLILSLTTAVVAFKSIQKMTQSSNQGLLFASIYTLSTYRLIDQSARGALGETLAFIFLPIILQAVYAIFYANKKAWLSLAVGMSGLLASHLITAFYTGLFLVLFALINYKKITLERVKILLKATVAFLLLSAWYILPYLEQTSKIVFNFTKVQLWGTGLNFTLKDLLGNSLANNSGTFEQLKPNFGLFLLAILVYAVVNYKKLSTSTQKVTLMMLAFIILSTNLFFWSAFKETFLAVIQFEWRLLIFVTLIGSLLATKVLTELNPTSRKKVFAIVLCSLTFLTISFNQANFDNSKAKNSLMITNKNVKNFTESDLGHGKEYLVKVNQSVVDYRTLIPVVRVNGNPYQSGGQSPTNRYNYSEYIVTANAPAIVQLPKFYYLGYQVLLDEAPTENYEKDGLLTVNMSSGQHIISVKYVGTPIQKVSLGISLISFLLFSGFYFRRKAKGPE